MSASLLGNEPLYVTEEAAKYTTSQLNYAQLIKKLEQTLGLFLTMRDKQNIQEAVQRYNWSYDLVYELNLVSAAIEQIDNFSDIIKTQMQLLHHPQHAVGNTDTAALKKPSGHILFRQCCHLILL